MFFFLPTVSYLQLGKLGYLSYNANTLCHPYVPDRSVLEKQLFNANRPSIYVRVMQCTFASSYFAAQEASGHCMPSHSDISFPAGTPRGNNKRQ